MDDILNNLNPEQQKAVLKTQGPLLVLAGPGTGKTHLLSVRCAKILQEERALPENILILTFTNTAAREMKERLVSIIGSRGYDVEICTFHSFANSVILESEEAAAYVKDRIQISDIERIKALEFILDNLEGIEDLRPFGNPYMFRGQIESRIGDLMKEDIGPEEFEKYIQSYEPDGVFIQEKHIPKLKALAKIYKMYENIKDAKVKGIFEDRGRYDYDDMIMFAVRALKNEAALNKKYQEQYKYIMVDEFQDTNGAQLDLLFLLVNAGSPNICCVGDDDQSIFRFQGATIANFKDLKERFPDLETVNLKDNYRSTKEIIELSSKIIRQLPDSQRISDKDLLAVKDFKAKNIEYSEFSTHEEELLYIIDKINKLKTILQDAGEPSPYNQIAVLVRKRDQIPKIIDAFLMAGIPYATDGKEDISSEPRVRQMLDILYLAGSQKPETDTDPSFDLYKVLCADYLHIEHNDILKLMAAIKKKNFELRRNPAKNANTRRFNLFEEFMSLFGQEVKSAEALGLKDPAQLQKAACAIKGLFNDAFSRPVHHILMSYIKDVNLYGFIMEKYDKQGLLKIRDLRALTSFINMVKDFDLQRPGIGIIDFLDEIDTIKDHQLSLQGELVTKTQDGVRIYTAHGAKGLEFHSVFIPFCIQYKNESSALRYYDETRLFYVAASRAKSNLFFTASPDEDSIKSSFIDKIGVEKKDAQKKEEAVLAQFLSKTESEDPFIDTQDILKDMVSNMTLSPTGLNSYIDCKRKFLYNDVLELPGKKKRSLVLGTCVHKALEMAYLRYKQTKVFPDFEYFKSEFMLDLRLQGVDKTIQKYCAEKFETFRKWFEKESQGPVVPIGLEKKISIMLADGLVFTGNYDKTEIIDEANKLVRVVDYKTGEPDKHIKNIFNITDITDPECDGYLRQLVSYKLLFEKDAKESKGYKIDSGMLVFIEPVKEDVIKYGLKKGDFIKKEVRLTQEMAKSLEGFIKQVWESIKNLDFEKLSEPDDKKCGNCDFKNICWQK